MDSNNERWSKMELLLRRNSRFSIFEYFKGLVAFIVQLNCAEEYNLLAYNEQILL